jgi:hypothetical protein
MTAATARIRCADHGQINPCLGCAGDHLAGAHAHGTRTETCRKCRAPRARDTTGLTDAPALAANDTDLTTSHRRER